MLNVCMRVCWWVDMCWQPGSLHQTLHLCQTAGWLTDEGKSSKVENARRRTRRRRRERGVGIKGEEAGPLLIPVTFKCFLSCTPCILSRHTGYPLAPLADALSLPFSVHSWHTKAHTPHALSWCTSCALFSLNLHTKQLLLFNLTENLLG